MQRIIKVLIVTSFTLPFGFSPLVFTHGVDTYFSILLTMSFAAFLPTSFVFYMYDTVLCMSGLKKGGNQLWKQMIVALGFILLVGTVLWLSHTRLGRGDLAMKDGGLVFVLSFMLFGAILNNVADQKLSAG